MKVTSSPCIRLHIGESGLVNFKAVKESLHIISVEIFRAVIIEEYLLFMKPSGSRYFPCSHNLFLWPAGIATNCPVIVVELQSGPSLSPSRQAETKPIVSGEIPFL